MKVKKKDWQTFEELSSRVYALLETAAVVKHDDRIYGHLTEKERQIDVSIRSRVAGHNILVIVQARDRKRAPDINSVGEFAEVLEDVGAAKGVIVCRKQPSKHVIKYARKKRIDFCSVFDIDDRKWSNDIAVPVKATLLKGVITPELTVIRAADSPPFTFQPGRTRFRVSKDGGANSLDLLEFISQLVVAKRIAANGRHELVVNDDQLTLEVGEVWFPLPSVSIDLNADVLRRFRFCRPDEYSALKNYSSGELSIAKLKLEVPPLLDGKAWEEADAVEPSSYVVSENVPIVDLSFSQLVESGGIGLSVLPE